ncbi:MAG: hypothetical protein CVV59_01455 [Tenericutes bacterium HGW-Tenericutes-4]|jgi:hypothetical protein|nr:MAG: hypothetical protein CVV59_01455 [Tenericutes bacterium HGW-Tenericutes-4]
MEKINVIVPILGENSSFLDDYKKLLQQLKKYESDELSFEVIFTMHKNFQKPKNFRSSYNVKLVSTNLNTKNDLIERGFLEIVTGSSLILELVHNNVETILEKLLSERAGDVIVRAYKKEQKQNKFKKFFKSFVLTVYNFYLKLFSLEKDLLCENTFQYFNENATQIIKNMPHKNAYLRNFDALIGYKQTKIEIEEKLECVLNKKEFAVIISIISVILGELFFVSTLALISLILVLDSGFILFILMLLGSFFLAFLGYYSLVKMVIKKRANL